MLFASYTLCSARCLTEWTSLCGGSRNWFPSVRRVPYLPMSNVNWHSRAHFLIITTNMIAAEEKSNDLCKCINEKCKYRGENAPNVIVSQVFLLSIFHPEASFPSEKKGDFLCPIPWPISSCGLFESYFPFSFRFSILLQFNGWAVVTFRRVSVFHYDFKKMFVRMPPIERLCWPMFQRTAPLSPRFGRYRLDLIKMQI